MLLVALLKGEPQSGAIWYEHFRQSPKASAAPKVGAKIPRRLSIPRRYLMDRESGDVERLSVGHGKTTCAWIHPDRTRVLYASTHEDPETPAKTQAELDLRKPGTDPEVFRRRAEGLIARRRCSSAVTAAGSARSDFVRDDSETSGAT